MTGVALQLTLTRDEVSPALARMLAAAGDLSEAMDDIGVRMVSNTEERFGTESGPDGKRWQPSYRAKTTGGRTLTDRGILSGSITHRYGPRSVEWGSNLIYARIHQRGGTIRAKNAGALHFPIGNGYAIVKQVTLPARPYLGYDDEDRRDVEEVLVAHLSPDGGRG